MGRQKICITGNKAENIKSILGKVDVPKLIRKWEV